MKRLIALPILLLAALACTLPMQRPMQSEPGGFTAYYNLTIDIDYNDRFYTETFNYSRDAQNVRHYVVVLPEDEIGEINPDTIFGSIVPTAEGYALREGREDTAWALAYLYEAPGGRFSGYFEPGTYGVAAAFITAPLSRDDADVEGDAVLWPGITGGAASTDLMMVEISATSPTDLTFEMTDADGWACPWVYVYNGTDYVRYSEILRNIKGAENAATETTPLVGFAVVDGQIRLRLSEEEDEISYIDSLYLLVDGDPVYADDPRLGSVDGDEVVMHTGDTLDLRFDVGAIADDATVEIVAHGYYVPLDRSE